MPRNAPGRRQIGRNRSADAKADGDDAGFGIAGQLVMGASGVLEQGRGRRAAAARRIAAVVQRSDLMFGK